MIFQASLLSFFTGFLSLCTEMLWVRIFSFLHGAIPQSFAFVLVFYLLGIAFGALLGKRYCEARYNLWLVSGISLIAASFSDLFGPFIYAEFFSTQQMGLGALLIFVSAFLKAVIFPIAHFIGVSSADDGIGKKISRVYVANIIGATLGPVFVTYLLLAFFSTQQAIIFCAALTFVVGNICLLRQIRTSFLGYMGAVMGLCLAGLLSLQANYLIAAIARPNSAIKRIIENQYGIIVIYKDKEDDIVYGGNVYDGRTNLNPLVNSNGINRLLILAALQEKPRRVLMIGLSIGTWLKLVTSFPRVEKIDVIEINPGYLQAIKEYPQQLSGIKDSRVSLVFDDGRRWLRNHPARIYDLIIINTTFHWRAYSTNLLSLDFLELVKSHMAAKAVLAYNTTGSPDALKTATILFKDAYLYENFIVAADFDWRKKLAKPEARATLSSLKIDGEPLFPVDKQMVIDFYLSEPVKTLTEVESDIKRQAEVIRDLNLISEYKYGRGL